MLSQKTTKNFDFAIDKKYFGKVSENVQFCNVEYIAQDLSHKIFIHVQSIRFNIWSLNYVKWCPELAAEIRSAAIDHYNINRQPGESFWDAEKEMIDSEK